jgi:hypothetical protein
VPHGDHVDYLVGGRLHIRTAIIAMTTGPWNWPKHRGNPWRRREALPHSLRAATGEKLARMLSYEKASGGDP